MLILCSLGSRQSKSAMIILRKQGRFKFILFTAVKPLWTKSALNTLKTLKLHYVMKSESTVWGKKNCTVFFAIALSEFHLLRQYLAHIYFNRFPIIHVYHVLYIVRDGEPASVLKVGLQGASALCTHSHRATLSRDARLQL